MKSFKFLLIVLVLPFILFGCNEAGEKQLNYEEKLELVKLDELLRAEVKTIILDKTETDAYDDGSSLRVISFDAVITSGKYKNYVIRASQNIDSGVGYRVKPVLVGDKVYLYISEQGGEIYCEYAELNRTGGVLWLIIIFAFVLLCFGRGKGFRALAALVITCLFVFFLFIPHVAEGGSPVLWALIVCGGVTLLGIFIIAGFSVKALSAILGCFVGVTIAGLVSYIFGNIMKFTGATDEYALSLAYQAPDISMGQLLFAATIIGAMGAAMDVAISIAVAVEELAMETDMKPGELISSGLRMGRDIMGTMSNTLILAYVGGSIHLILLLYLNSGNLGHTVSWEMIASEIVHAISGSLGLIMVVPATAIISGFMYKDRQKRDNPF